ncbi:hypothetical protein BU17DRAFT_100977 [Hysterangium stoloniferum]|nr:hypothetical protein BU17DRAFT_100977 [Hysterangium stoloniferum]
MEFWPADFRADATPSKRKRRKGKDIYKLNEQAIEHGTLGAATLTTGKDALKWITLVQPSSGFSFWSLGGPVEVFPPTRSPPVVVPKLSLQQRAEQGLQFLQTYHPDVEVSLHLLKDELESDDDYAAAAAAMDPYVGSRLAHLSFITKRKKTYFLAFVTGETSAQLNISAFRSDHDGRFVFCPSAEPVLTFDTPILQLAPFTTKSIATQTFCLLAVRTHAVVSIVKVQGKPKGADGQIIANVVTMISLSETANRRIVDMAPGFQSSSSTKILLVNDVGVVYNCKIQGEKKIIASPPDISIAGGQELDDFWRIAWRDPNSCMRASSKKVDLFDLRARSSLPRELLHLGHSNEFVTFIISLPGTNPMTCVATTSRLLWFDERNINRPLISLKHQRAFDRSLRLSSVTIDSSTFVALSSSLNPLVTIHETSVTPCGHLQLRGMPSILPGAPAIESPLAGSLLYSHSEEINSIFWHFQLSSRGSLWKTDLSLLDSSVSQVPEPASNGFEWNEEVNLLAKKAENMVAEVGKLGEREYINANLRDVYDKVFNMRDVSPPQSEDTEAVYQVLDKMPFFWQDMNEPMEYMLTTFDIAFQSGSKPLHEFRADFLTGSLLNLPRGFVALTNGRVPIHCLTSTALWYHDISTLPRNMTPDLNIPSHVLIDRVRQAALASLEGPHGITRAIDASQQLVLDLALSRHVYSPHPFTKSGSLRHNKSDSDELSEATEAMSLGGRSTRYAFGFFRPREQVPYQDNEQMMSDDEDDAGGAPKLPAGIHTLLSEWEIGSNPAEYLYKDRYYVQEDLFDPTINNAQGMHVPAKTATIPPVIDSSAMRPPVILPSSSRPSLTQLSRPGQTDRTRGSHMVSDSSPPRPLYSIDELASQMEHSYLFSQELVGPSTQPLPGPFGGGGRQLGVAKKKAVKKRMGGF